MIFYAMAGQKGYKCGTQKSILYCEKPVKATFETFDDLPELKYVMSGISYTLNLNLLVADCGVNTKNGQYVKGCLFKLRSMYMGMRILGMPFMQQNYVIFDKDQLKIGIVAIESNLPVKEAKSIGDAWTPRNVGKIPNIPKNHVIASRDEKSIKKGGPSVFFFFAFLTLTAVLVIIIYFVATKLLDEDNDENGPGSEQRPLDSANNERVELLPVNRNVVPQINQDAIENPYNPFNQSMDLSLREDADRGSYRYNNIGGGIATIDNDQPAQHGNQILQELNPTPTKERDPFVAFKPEVLEHDPITEIKHLELVPREQNIVTEKQDTKSPNAFKYDNEIHELSQIKDASYMQVNETILKEESKDLLKDLDNYNPYDQPQSGQKTPTPINKAEDSYDPYNY